MLGHGVDAVDGAANREPIVTEADHVAVSPLVEPAVREPGEGRLAGVVAVSEGRDPTRRDCVRGVDPAGAGIGRRSVDVHVEEPGYVAPAVADVAIEPEPADQALGCRVDRCSAGAVLGVVGDVALGDTHGHHLVELGGRSVGELHGAQSPRGDVVQRVAGCRVERRLTVECERHSGAGSTRPIGLADLGLAERGPAHDESRDEDREEQDA